MSEDQVGQTVGPYLLEAPLGTGGMSSVYRGVHRYMHVARAVKVMAPALAAHERFVRLFRREAELASSLNHPNIVRIYDVGVDGVTHYLVMELLEGRTLREVIRKDRPIAIDRVLTLIRQLGSALDYAHDNSIAHRDVKPANVFVSSDDHLTLVDLGIARAAEHTRLTITQGAGTPEYMAPEMFDEDLADPGHDEHARAVGADLYSLGLVTYELLTGTLPFKARSRQSIIYSHVHRPPIRPREHRPDLSLAVEEVLLRQLRKRPFERYATANAFADALARAADSGKDELSPGLALAPTVERAPRPEPRDAPLADRPPRSESHEEPTERAASARRAPDAAAASPTPVPSPPLPRADVPSPGAPVPSTSSTKSGAWRGRRIGVAILVGISMLFVVLALNMQVLNGPFEAPAGAVMPGAAPTANVPPAATSPATPVTQTIPTAQAATPPPQAATQAAVTSTAITPTLSLALATPTLSAAARLQAGQAAAFAGDFERAISLLVALKREQADTPGLDNALYRTHMDYAATLRDRGEHQQGLVQLDEALRLRPGDAAATAARQDTELLSKWAVMEASWGTDDDRAIEALEGIWAVQPDYRETRQKLYTLLIARADRLLAKGDGDGAFPILMHALDVQPDAPEARVRLGSYTPTPVPAPTRVPTRPPAPTPVPPQPVRQPAPQPTATKVPFLPAP